MTAAAWKPEYTTRAQRIWENYQRLHDLSDRQGKWPLLTRIVNVSWIGDSGVDAAQQMQVEGVDAPVYLVRVGSDHLLQKGRRESKAL